MIGGFVGCFARLVGGQSHRSRTDRVRILVRHGTQIERALDLVAGHPAAVVEAHDSRPLRATIAIN